MKIKNQVLEQIVALENYARENGLTGLMARLHGALEVYAAEASPDEKTKIEAIEFLNSRSGS